MTTRDIPDSHFRCVRLDAYNHFRRHRHLRPLNVDEYNARCDWMAVYRDTTDPDEREHYVRLLKAQDERPNNPGEPPDTLNPELVPMPPDLRDLLTHLVGTFNAGGPASRKDIR